MSAIRRVLRPDGTFLLAIGDEYAAELKVIATRELGFTCRSWVVWYYTFGVNCQQKFNRSHAHLFHFVCNPKSFTFNADAIRVPSARELVYGDRREQTLKGVFQMTLGSCGLRISRTASTHTKTRGTFLEYVGLLRSDPVGMDAKCLNNFLDGLFGHQANQEILFLILLLEVEQRWLLQRNLVAHTSGLNFLRIMLRISENVWLP